VRPQHRNRPWSGGWADSSGGVVARNGVGVGGRWQQKEEKNKICKGERKRAATTPSGQKVDVVASCGGAGGWKFDGDKSGGWDGGEKRESEHRRQKNHGEEGWFSTDFGPDFLLLRTWNQLLFIGVEEGNHVFIGEKFSALDLTGRIQTIGSKYVPCTTKSDSPRLPELATLGQSPEQFWC